MRALENVLEDAASQSIQMTCIIFPVWLADRLWLPSWTLDFWPWSGPSIVSGHMVTRRSPKNLLSEESVIRSQALLVRELVGEFSRHPGLGGWVLGSGLERTTVAESMGAFENWLGSMKEAAARTDQARLRLEVGAQSLIIGRTIPFGTLHSQEIDVQVRDDWKPAWATADSRLWPAFLAGFATRHLRSPAVVAQTLGYDYGWSSDPHATLTAVQRAGGGGCIAASLFDFSESLRRSPPFHDDPSLLHRGLLRTDGMLKDITTAWLDFVHSPETLRETSGFPVFDPDMLARDPEAVARECYEEFTS
jgi:hypothetical protein